MDGAQAAAAWGQGWQRAGPPPAPVQGCLLCCWPTPPSIQPTHLPTAPGPPTASFTKMPSPRRRPLRASGTCSRGSMATHRPLAAPRTSTTSCRRVRRRDGSAAARPGPLQPAHGLPGAAQHPGSALRMCASTQPAHASHPRPLLQVRLPDGAPYETTKDHSKWGVHRDRPLCVIGDVNRTQT